MSVKLVVLKSGEDIITDVQEMVVGDENEQKVVGYFFDKPCVVKLFGHTPEEDRESPFRIQMMPWIPLSDDEKIPVAADWVITIVEPIEKVKELYLKKVSKSSEEQTDGGN